MKLQTLNQCVYPALVVLCLMGPLAAQSKPSTTVDALQVAVGDCITATTEADVTGTHKSAVDAIAVAAISQGVNYLGKALTAAGAAKTWTATGSRNFQATSDAFPQCVLVARGTFDSHASTAASYTLEAPWPADTPAKLFKAGLKLHDAPSFLFEGQIVGSANKAALTVRPLTATFSKPIGTRWFRWGKERNVAVFLSITEPGGKPTLDTNPAATLVLGEFDENTTRQYDTDKNLTSPFESPWFSLTKIDSLKPLTVNVMLSETQDEDDFLTYLGAVFSDSKASAAIDNGLSNVLVPGVRAQSDQTAQSKTSAADNDVDTKFAAALVKLDACTTATGSAAITAGAAARTALRDYLTADRAASTHANIVDDGLIARIDLNSGSAKIIASCKSIQSQLVKP